MSSCLAWVDLDPQSEVDREIMQREHKAVIERFEDGAPEDYPRTRQPMGTRVPLGSFDTIVEPQDFVSWRKLS